MASKYHNTHHTSAHSLMYLQNREYFGGTTSWRGSRGLYCDRVDLHKTMYSRSLYGHYGCVNAIEFSTDEKYIISGSDDKRVLVWNSVKAGQAGYKPFVMEKEHRSNIFTVTTDCQDRRIFSGGNDSRIEVHDFQTGNSVGAFKLKEAIYSISGCPDNPSVISDANEDGEVLIHDMRSGFHSEPLVLANSYKAFHSVQFHPLRTNFLVTANSKNGVALYDMRMPNMVVTQYSLRHSAMSARFNKDGTMVLSLRRRSRPALYHASTGQTICRFDANHYYNSCTMKTCCFGGPNDEYIFSGSDDFTLYMWKIPSDTSQKTFLKQPHNMLKGHRSIVNQVRYNSRYSYVASSGVEKVIKLWSPFPIPGEQEELPERRTRRVYSHAEYIEMVLEGGASLGHDYYIGNMREDSRMLAFFDTLVQREVGGWTSNSDRSDEEDSYFNEVEDRAFRTSPRISDDSTDSLDTEREDQEVPLGDSSEGNDEVVICHFASHPGCERCRGSSNNSSWVLRLIERKRAQLRTAKRTKLRQERRRLQKATESALEIPEREYLYCPASEDLPSEDRPSTSRRHEVGPYTMVSNQDNFTLPSSSTGVPQVKRTLPGLHDSSDEEVLPVLRKRIRLIPNSSEGRVNPTQLPSTSSGTPDSGVSVTEPQPSSSSDSSPSIRTRFACRKAKSRTNYRKRIPEDDDSD